MPVNTPLATPFSEDSPAPRGVNPESEAWVDAVRSGGVRCPKEERMTAFSPAFGPTLEEKVGVPRLLTLQLLVSFASPIHEYRVAHLRCGPHFFDAPSRLFECGSEPCVRFLCQFHRCCFLRYV